MTARFPHVYEVALAFGGGAPPAIDAPPRLPFVVGPPPEFDGSDAWWSPEHLLLAAVASCLATTFRVLLAKEPLDIRDYRSRVTGTLDKTREGIVFTSISVDVTMTAPGEQAPRAEALLLRAKKYCIVANSLKPEVTLHVHFDSTTQIAA
jgi:organic hydroperoxide reductase OsmC/OhrA